MFELKREEELAIFWFAFYNVVLGRYGIEIEDRIRYIYLY